MYVQCMCRRLSLVYQREEQRFCHVDVPPECCPLNWRQRSIWRSQQVHLWARSTSRLWKQSPQWNSNIRCASTRKAAVCWDFTGRTQATAYPADTNSRITRVFLVYMVYVEYTPKILRKHVYFRCISRSRFSGTCKIGVFHEWCVSGVNYVYLWCRVLGVNPVYG